MMRLDRLVSLAGVLLAVGVVCAGAPRAVGADVSPAISALLLGFPGDSVGGTHPGGAQGRLIYQWDVTVTQSCQATITSDQFRPVLVFYDQYGYNRGYVITPAGKNNVSLTVKLFPETFYLGVYSYDGRSGDFTLTVSEGKLTLF